MVARRRHDGGGALAWDGDGRERDEEQEEESWRGGDLHRWDRGGYLFLMVTSFNDQ
jgi:hypothetical protein